MTRFFVRETLSLIHIIEADSAERALEIMRHERTPRDFDEVDSSKYHGEPEVIDSEMA